MKSEELLNQRIHFEIYFQKLAPKCHGGNIYEFSTKDIQYILHLHNDYRNAICNGSISGFEPCKQMAKLVSVNRSKFIIQSFTRTVSIKRKCLINRIGMGPGTCKVSRLQFSHMLR